ncbi:hypothetical protein B0H14DRAFT_2621792 [Mycena olivaceomarginata]|nr:hypothetical protein B0H14DRAFT_2621792 [Mycena olivaceomarginata]
MNQSDFSAEFTGLDSRIADLQAQISSSSMDNPALESASIRRRIIMGRSIVHAAVIQLHGTFVHTNMESKGKCLVAAQAILQFAVNADLLGSSFICPLFSIRGFIMNIWATVSEVAIDEIGALRAACLPWAHELSTPVESALVHDFKSALNAMQRFTNWPLLSVWGVNLVLIWKASSETKGKLSHAITQPPLVPERKPDQNLHDAGQKLETGTVTLQDWKPGSRDGNHYGKMETNYRAVSVTVSALQKFTVFKFHCVVCAD